MFYFFIIIIQMDTISDMYMIVSGIPERNEDNHAREIALMSLALMDACRRFLIRHLPTEKLEMRMGIHSGIQQCCCY